MPFPLPADSEFRKLIISFWLDDIDDRLKINQVGDAKKSWRIANDIYLSLPPGEGDDSLESKLIQARVKIDNTSQKL